MLPPTAPATLTLREAIEAFKKDLDEAKRSVPKRKLKAIHEPILHDGVTKAVRELYTEQEIAQLKAANDEVFTKYEIGLYVNVAKPSEHLVKPLEPWPPIDEDMLENNRAECLRLFSWSGGVIEYAQEHRKRLVYTEADTQMLSSAKVQHNPQTKALILDLRTANLKGCDLRCVDIENKYLQYADMEGAFLDFACIKSCFVECADFRNVQAVGLLFEASRFHGCKFVNATLSGAQGGSIFDGSIFDSTTLNGMNLSKGKMTECHASHWQACKFKRCDVRGTKFVADSAIPAPHKLNASAFYGSDFRNCNFGGICEFRYCSMEMDARGSDLQGCDLREALNLRQLVPEPLRPLRAAAPRSGAACGAIAVAVGRQLCGQEDDEEEDDGSEEEEEEEDGDGARAGARADDDGDGGDTVMDALLASAQSRAEESLLSLAEEGGATLGARAVAHGDETEELLSAKLRSADETWKAKASLLVRGLRAQGRAVVAAGDPEERARRAAGFDEIRKGLGELAQGRVTQAAMERAETALKENATPSTLAKFMSGQLKMKTSYDIQGWWGMAKAVMSVSPAKIHTDTNEIKRLLGKFEKLDQPVLKTTWTELTDTWLTLYMGYGRMQTERGRLILEQIFSNKVIRRNVAVARQLQDINHFDDPPEDLLKLLKAAKVELTRRIDDYTVAADAEVVKMGKIQARQQQLIGGLSIVLISVGTSVGNFLSQSLYHHLHGH